MRVAIVGPVFPFRGGIAHYTASLAFAFQQLEHEAKVFSYSRQYPQWLYPGKSDRDPSQQTIQVPAEYTIDTLFPWTWIKTAQSVIQYRPDLVIFNWWTTFMAPAFFVMAGTINRQKIPIFYLVHNVYPHEKKWFDGFLVRLGLTFGDAYIVQSHQEEQKILKLFPNARVYFHPHPVYDFMSSVRVDKKEAKTRLGLNPELPVALFFGIVRPYKGLSLLIEAISQLKQRGEFVQLLVAGEFWENVHFYEKLIEDSGIKDQVFIHNRYIPDEEVPVYFSAGDVFVAPYTAGTQSGAVKLAMGFDIPIVVSEVIADDVMKSNSKTRTFSFESPDQLAHLIISALKGEKDIYEGTEENNSNSDWKSLVQEIENISHAVSK